MELARQVHRLLGEALGRQFYSVPAFDMLLDLYLLGDGKPRSLTSLCVASAAPVRTALRTINRLVDQELLVRTPDERDARRINVALTGKSVALLERFLDALSAELIRMQQ